MRSRLLGIENNADPVLRKNFQANVLDGALYAFGMSFVSIQTVLPVLVVALGGTNVAVGLVPVVWTFGSNFPQIFMSRLSQRLPYKKSLFMKTSLIQRLPWLTLALFCYLLPPNLDTQTRLGIFFALLLLTAAAGSMNFPIWFDLVAKLTPTRMRGRMFASRAVGGSVLGVLGGWLMTHILGGLSYPANYGTLFLVAFALMMASYLFLAGLRETTPSIARPTDRRQSLIQAASILRQDANFRNFLMADGLLIASTLAAAFFAVHALERFHLPQSSAGLFTVVIMLSTVAGSLGFGYVADHYGHKRNLLISAVSMLVSSLIALMAVSVEWYLLAFAGAATTASINLISRLPIIAEFCDESSRAAYVAIANTVTAPIVLLGIAAGWAADSFGFGAVFGASALSAGAAWLWLWRNVREPRHLPAFSLPEHS